MPPDNARWQIGLTAAKIDEIKAVILREKADVARRLHEATERLLEAAGREARHLALLEACLIAGQVATLAEGMQSPFKEGFEQACEEIITRLMEAGAPR